ncbi:MAG TPA: efflux RND transporter periplasmic adaptor subunit [Tepidisphaeraceae bacterium]|nr:efflux RND transporter periplasmic adaptor subunit [Tepidisphaeraceae bacterium]
MSSRFLRSIWIAMLVVVCGIVLAATHGSPTETHSRQESSTTGKLLWWDPMLGPSSITDHPGKSAMGMDLVPYTRPSVSSAELQIDPRVVQEMGVQTAVATRGQLHKTIRAVGTFELPQPGLHDIALKVGGWIDKLYVDQEGMHVHKGEPLFALYSPELQVSEQELISAVQSRKSLGADASATVTKEAENLIASARRKLELWDLDEREIDAIAKADRAQRDVTFYSPASGHVEDKMIVQGSAVQPGMKLLRIADHSVMWLDAQVYEQQIPLVKIGQPVEATLDAVPGKTFRGEVSFIYPHLDHMTRTLTVRATFDNPDFELKPGMYADANLVSEPVEDALQVPQEAVIDTGTKQIVFVAQGDGHFGPRTVRTGIRGDDDKIQILDGLSDGEKVVTSGQFLMDVESRTQEAVAKLRGSSEMANVSTAPPTSAPTSQPTTPSKVSLIYCPMAKANWLQVPGDVSNPYLDADMRDCGEIKSQIDTPSKDSPVAQVFSDYLAVQHSLASDHFDGKLAEKLKSDSAKLKGGSYAALKKAADEFAAAHDLKAARLQFKAVSQAIIELLNPKSGK